MNDVCAHVWELYVEQEGYDDPPAGMPVLACTRCDSLVKGDTITLWFQWIQDTRPELFQRALEKAQDAASEAALEECIHCAWTKSHAIKSVWPTGIACRVGHVIPVEELQEGGRWHATKDEHGADG